MFETVLNWGFAGPVIFIAFGMAVLIGGGEMLIRGAVRCAAALKIPAVIIGLTVVAFGTSAPELAVSLSAALKGSADLAVGNVVGSNICNVGLILGFAALLSPITVSTVLIRREIPLMIFLAFLMYILAIIGAKLPITAFFSPKYAGLIPVWAGVLLVTGLALYTAWTIFAIQKNKTQNTAVEETLSVVKNGTAALLTNLVLIVCGIGLLVAGSDLMVQGSVQIARLFGVSELIIGLTILAVGTSLPELVVSVMSAIQGKSDIALGNVIGSNIFNILGVLGVTALFSGGTETVGLQVSAQALRFDMPIMILLSLICMIICVTRRRVTRVEGFFFFLCYAGYLTALCFTATVAKASAL